MKCQNCNTELLENTTVCPNCGENCESTPAQVVDNSQEEVQNEAGCWATFAKVSKILGIITICTFWIPVLGLYAMLPGIPGIVFGILGKRSKKDGAAPNANKGFVLSLVGTILAVAVYFIFIVVMSLISSL